MPAADLRVTRGTWHPLGATVTPEGVNFALFTRHAEAVHLLLFDGPEPDAPHQVVKLPKRTRFTWHGHVEGVRAGQCYAYRVEGPYAPREGHRFNAAKVLLDPYARAITGEYDLEGPHFDYEINSPDQPDPHDNLAWAPRCVVVDDSFDWGDDAPPETPLHRTVLYEVHLKGLTAHPSSGVAHPGTYLGVIEKIPYLKSLGITAVEFLPVHHRQTELLLGVRGLTNYWGYSTLGYFAPDRRFAAGTGRTAQVTEFKRMVQALHAAGLEVILDVVYNHTCEVDENGPTYFLRGIDNSIYYRLDPKNPRRCLDYTGCGNTLNTDRPEVVKLIMDSMRYWVQEMRVDGFRFDLASALARDGGRFDVAARLLTAIHQDPVLSNIKLIAEPWDLGPGATGEGSFPVAWAEWNGRYRDCVRRFVKGEPGIVGELAYRLSGSSDLYEWSGRTPYQSINFVTSHDGFTLWDLVSYSSKHNEANQEENRDGTESNHSWNWGVEGHTADPEILGLRRRLARTVTATLILSQGTPMLLGGDELLRTQRGNNNAYCQDNDISWFDWDRARGNADMVEFVRRLVAFRKTYPHFLRHTFFTGADRDQDELADINWYDETLAHPDWGDAQRRSLAFLMDGKEIEEPWPTRDDVMVLLNASWEPRRFRLPRLRPGEWWLRMVDTALPTAEAAAEAAGVALEDPGSYLVGARSLVALVRRRP